MAMLAEKKRKVKHSIQPKSKPLWETGAQEQPYAQKLMEKMGWSIGKGLGANEQGIQEPIRAIYKQDVKGIGFVDDGNPFHNQNEFNEILASLHSDSSTLRSDNTVETSNNFSSLEEKSASNKTRVLYKKFARGKDLSRYSSEDLACILGTGKKKKSDEEDDNLDNIGDKDHSFGVTTVKGGSIQDYFVQKKRIIAVNIDNNVLENYENSDKTEALYDESEQLVKRKKKKKKSTKREHQTENEEDTNLSGKMEKSNEKEKLNTENSNAAKKRKVHDEQTKRKKKKKKMRTEEVGKTQENAVKTENESEEVEEEIKEWLELMKKENKREKVKTIKKNGDVDDNEQNEKKIEKLGVNEKEKDIVSEKKVHCEDRPEYFVDVKAFSGSNLDTIKGYGC